MSGFQEVEETYPSKIKKSVGYFDMSFLHNLQLLAMFFCISKVVMCSVVAAASIAMITLLLQGSGCVVMCMGMTVDENVNSLNPTQAPYI